jgi:transcriptional regulator with GAF, ATPase, and Fis domain
VIPDDVMRVLETYDWPGNVRELENVIHRAIILSTGPALSIREAWQPSTERPAVGQPITMVEIERCHVRSVLETAGWRVEGAQGAARVLGMKPSTLRSRMVKLGIARLDRTGAAPAACEAAHES